MSSLPQSLRALPLVRWARRVKRARAADVLPAVVPEGRPHLGPGHARASAGRALRRARAGCGELGDRTYRHPGVPRILAKHDGNPHRATADAIDPDRSEYAGTRVILMVRDPRDAVVSNYFQVTRREGVFQGDLATWLRAPRGSVDSMLRYYAVWARQRDVPQAFLLLRYEDVTRGRAARVATHRRVHRVARRERGGHVARRRLCNLRMHAPARGSAAGGRHAAGAGTTGRPGIVQGAPRQGGRLRRVPDGRGRRVDRGPACAPSSIPSMATERPRSRRPPSRARRAPSAMMPAPTRLLPAA